MSRTIPPVLELTLLPRKPLRSKETQVQVPMHTRLSRQSGAHSATKGSSEQAVLLLSVCMPSNVAHHGQHLTFFFLAA